MRAVILASHAVSAHLPDGRRIISIDSNLASHSSRPGVRLYSASKAALEGWTMGLARDLVPPGISVDAVHRGPTSTDLTPPDGPLTAQLLERMAMPRFTDPDEVAALVAFNAGPYAAAITVAGLLVDGGTNS